MLQAVKTVRSARGLGHDRALVHRLDDCVLLAVADGAGGTGGGAEAADAIIEAVAAAPATTAWAALLAELDGTPARLGHGETTAVVACVSERGIVGASVGDSAAWVIRNAAIEELTRNQQRKPLVGAGATPVGFASAPLGAGTLLLATDGLFKYVRRDAILAACAAAELVEAASALVDHAMRTAGELVDDIAIVLARS